MEQEKYDFAEYCRRQYREYWEMLNRLYVLGELEENKDGALLPLRKTGELLYKPPVKKEN